VAIVLNAAQAVAIGLQHGEKSLDILPSTNNTHRGRTLRRLLNRFLILFVSRLTFGKSILHLSLTGRRAIIWMYCKCDNLEELKCACVFACTAISREMNWNQTQSDSSISPNGRTFHIHCRWNTKTVDYFRRNVSPGSRPQISKRPRRQNSVLAEIAYAYLNTVTAPLTPANHTR